MSESKVNPIPSQYQRVIPYLIVNGAAGLIEFLQKVFDAQITEEMKSPSGKIGHAEVKIGDCTIMISDADGDYKPNPTMLYVYVEDTDSVYKKALEAGAKSVREPSNQFYGDRNAMVTDATGNSWGIASHVEDIPPDEMKRRAEEMMKKSGD